MSAINLIVFLPNISYNKINCFKFNYSIHLMKFSVKIIFIFCFLLFAISTFKINVLLPSSFTSTAVQAEEIWDQQKGMDSVSKEFGADTDDPVDIRTIMVSLIKVFLTFLGIIFLVLIIMAGYKWMTAAGNEDQVKEAKSTLSRAIVGLIIIISAYAITEFILENLIHSTSDSPFGPNNADFDDLDKVDDAVKDMY